MPPYYDDRIATAAAIWQGSRSAGCVTGFTLCTVVDQHPRFHVELVLWAICSATCLPPHLFRLVVYFVGSPPPDLADWLSGRGIEVRTTAPVVPGAPHCNKLAPFFDFHDSQFTAVTDTDLFFVDDPSPLLASGRFRAPPNIACNPPACIFRKVLKAAGLGRPYRPTMALIEGNGTRETCINNINGGFIIAPNERRAAFVKAWKKWAFWLVDNRHLLETWGVYIDQVAFALSMEELGEDVEFLPPQTNVVLHILEEIASAYAFHLSSAHVPHFPQRFNPDRTLSTVGLESHVASAVQRLNESIREAADTIKHIPSTREHLGMFLNPNWSREDERFHATTDANAAVDTDVVRVNTIFGPLLAFKDDLITQQLQDFGAHTRNELALLRHFVEEGDLIYDVGAHIGTFALPLATSAGVTGTVVAIEAEPRHFDLLKRNVEAHSLTDRIHLWNVAVSDTHEFYSSRGRAGNTGATRMEAQEHGAIKSLRLDKIHYSVNSGKKISILKIDTEGMELAVLNSCAELIERDKPVIYLEVAQELLDKYGVSIEDIDSRLRALGYRFFRNSGERNSENDKFKLIELVHLAEGGPFFDVLAVHHSDRRLSRAIDFLSAPQ